MNHGSTSGHWRLKNWVRRGEKKLKKYHESSELFPLLVKWRWPYSNTTKGQFIGKSRVSKDTYFDTLNNVWNAIECKRPGLLSRKLCLLCDKPNPIPVMRSSSCWRISNEKCSSTLRTCQTSCQATTTSSKGSRKNNLSLQLNVYLKICSRFHRDGIEKLVSLLNKCLQKMGIMWRSYIQGCAKVSS